MLSLEEKIGQMIYAGFYGLEAPDHILQWLSEGKIGGVILFGRNIDTPEQVAKLTDSLHRAAKYPILVSIDQEGGIVARFRQGFTEFPGAMALGAAGSETLAEEVALTMAKEMRALGINWDYAPVVDLTHDINNPSVGTRSVGADKELVGRIAAAQVRGLQAGGVAACAKHFPGIGRSPVDTHVALAVVEGSVDEVLATDLEPFRRTVEAGVATVMVGHVKFAALDPDYPSTLSPVIIQKLLRENIGFTGMTSSDCMEMNAITHYYTPAQTAILAALAGIDTILFSHTREVQEAAYDGLLEAVQSGQVPETVIDAAVTRILNLKNQFALTEYANPGHIRAESSLRVADDAARAGMVLVKDSGLLPLDLHHKIGLIEFASVMESGVVEKGEETGLVSIVKQTAPQIDCVSMMSLEQSQSTLDHAYKLTEQSHVLIVATRNAHLVPEQLTLARNFMQKARRVILVCLRNPYDAGVLPDASAILCTCGDSTPSLQAAVDALFGKFIPAGKLPVKLDVRN